MKLTNKKTVFQTIAFCAAICFCVVGSRAQNAQKGGAALGKVEQVFAFNKQMPTGVTVSPEPLFTATVEGKDLKKRKPGQPPMHIRLGADGIAISADGSRLYYCPLASRKLYSVSTDALLDANLTETELAAAVRDEGEKPAADGLESDAEGRIYSTAYEQDAITRRAANGGKFEIIAQVAPMYWTDTMSVASNGYLYFTGNELHRQAGYNDGRDLRQKPYRLFRLKIDGTPVKLR